MHGPIAQSVEHRADNAGVSGSIPLGPTREIGFWACSSVGRAPALQAGGHRFEPGQVHGRLIKVL